MSLSMEELLECLVPFLSVFLLLHRNLMLAELDAGLYHRDLQSAVAVLQAHLNNMRPSSNHEIISSSF